MELFEKRKRFKYVLYCAKLEMSWELWNYLRKWNYLSKYYWVEVGFAVHVFESNIINVNICLKITAFATWKRKNEDYNFMEPVSFCFSFK